MASGSNDKTIIVSQMPDIFLWLLINVPNFERLRYLLKNLEKKTQKEK